MSKANKAPASIVCLVDNLAPSGSGFWAEHGISFYVEAGDTRLLFDTGQSGDVLLHNARLAGISLRRLDYVVLSHGHYDHAGGLSAVLDTSPGVTVIVHPAAFEKKFARRGGELKNIGLPLAMDALEKLCELRVEAGPVDLGGGVSTTGEIRRVTACERPQPDLLVESDGALEPDPVMDDQSLVVRNAGGMLLLCGCCHAGVVNTIESVKHRHGEYPALIAGGLHVEKASPGRISKTVKALKAAGVEKAIAGHCSGSLIGASLARAGIGAERLASGMSIMH